MRRLRRPQWQKAAMACCILGEESAFAGNHLLGELRCSLLGTLHGCTDLKEDLKSGWIVVVVRIEWEVRTAALLRLRYGLQAARMDREANKTGIQQMQSVLLNRAASFRKCETLRSAAALKIMPERRIRFTKASVIRRLAQIETRIYFASTRTPR